MALVLKDRVKQTAAAPGTGTITLSGSVTGFQSFSVIGNGNTTYFAIYDPVSGDWEVNYGTYTSSGTTLTRNASPLSSSAGGALVNFTGTVDVFVTYPSENAVWRDTSGVVVQQDFGAITATSAALTSGTINTVPTVGTDIANKAYVDTTATGLHVHQSVYVSTTGTGAGTTYADGGTTPTWTTITSTSEIATGSAHGLSVGAVIVFGSTTNGLTAGTAYFVKSTPTTTSITLSLILNGPTITTLTNGTGLSITSRANSGVGATITSNSVGTLTTIDGVAVTVSNRVLVWTWTNAYANGVYTITSVGSGATPWVLTRATDANTYDPRSDTGLGEGDYFFIENGNTYKGDSVVLGTQGTIVFGTTNLTFNVFANSVVYSAGTGLTLTDTTFSITDTGVSAAAYGSASVVPVITVNAQGQVTSVTNTTIAINGTQVSGAISGQAGSVANALTAGTYLTSGGTYDGSAARTFAVDATDANTASKVVARDSSGNFSAGTITATLSGAATSATTATNIAGGAANQIPYQTGAATTSFITAPTGAGTYLNWSGSALAWSAISTPNAATFNNGGAGDASGTTFNGSAARTISYNTVGASPLAGSSSLTTTGTVTSGTWSASFGAVSGANLTSLTAGNLSGTIPSAVLGNSTAYVGTTAVALNRSSANQALTGITSVTLPGATSGSAQITPNAVAGTGTVLTLPATTGTLALTSDLPTVNNATLTMNTSGTGLSGSQTFTANQATGATFTVTSNATNANTASTIVARDASGNFSAGTITATLTGQASSVANSHSAGTYLTGSAYNGSAAQTWAVDATSANTASKVVARDASGNFSAGTITATLSGSATSAGTATTASGLTGTPNITVGTITAGDITTYRSGAPTTGYIYWGNTGTKYMGFDGSNIVASVSPSFSITGSSASCTGNAATASAVAFSGITGKPTTLSGYGITNADVSGGNFGGSFNFNTNANLASGTYGFDTGALNGPASVTYSNFLQIKERPDTSAQIVVDYQTGYMYTRGIYITAPTYSAWQTQLSSGNYNSYAPTLTGTGASGSWGISVTGSSASCTGNAATATNVGGLVANSYTSYGGSATTNAPNGYYGLLFGTSTSHSQTMYDGSGNGGQYNQGFGWISYFLKSNSSLGIMSSTTSSSYALYVTGSIYATANVTAYSDRRAKKNIETIDNALDKTKQLRGVYYRAIEEQVKDESHHGKRLMGVIAQEVLEVVPEVVTYDKENDKYGVSYANMVGLLIEAVKELSDKVTEQDARIARLEALVTKLIED